MKPETALQGIKILDFSRYMQGPHCSQMLGDMGAEVIKVERVGTGDDNRGLPFNRIRGVNSFFLALNRNKRSLTLDLKHPKAKTILDRLLPTCDVLLENFRPGTLDKVGLSYEAVAPRHPRLIYCSCSGYGQGGPYRDRPGQDLLAQAMGGLASVTGRSGGYPRTVGSYVVDAYGAMLAAVGILAALQARVRTGRGQRVDVCLLDAALHMQCQELAYHLNGGVGGAAGERRSRAPAGARALRGSIRRPTGSSWRCRPGRGRICVGPSGSPRWSTIRATRRRKSDWSAVARYRPSSRRSSGGSRVPCGWSAWRQKGSGAHQSTLTGKWSAIPRCSGVG